MTDKPMKDGDVEIREIDSALADESYRALFEETGNPVYPWTVIASRSFGNRENKLPDWVLDYLGKTATEIMRFSYLAARNEPIGNVNEIIVRALGFKSERGVPAAFGEYGKRARDLTLGGAVAARLENGKCRSKTEAYRDVAVDFHVAWDWDLSPRTVERAYEIYKKATKQ
jgi:hypothetical protein